MRIRNVNVVTFENEECITRKTKSTTTFS